MGLLAWKGRSWKERVKPALAGCIAGGLLMAPWVVFNMTRFANPVALSTGPWSGISAGTCDKVFYGTFIGYYRTASGTVPRRPRTRASERSEPGRDSLGATSRTTWIGSRS